MVFTFSLAGDLFFLSSLLVLVPFHNLTLDAFPFLEGFRFILKLRLDAYV